jgi:hypothetical protein
MPVVGGAAALLDWFRRTPQSMPDAATLNEAFPGLGNPEGGRPTARRFEQVPGSLLQ